MSEGDGILLETLKKLFPNETSSDFKKLSDFSTDFVLEIVAKLLNVIYEPEVPFENVKPPPSMSARYKLSSNLAEKCQSLGYDNVDLGTFLYVNETDLRAVLMFLIDKIPAKVEDIKDEEELGANALIRKEIKESLKISSEIVSSDTNDPWNAWEVEEMKEEEMWKLLPKETRNAAIEAKIKLSSLIQHNEELKEGKIQTNSEVRRDDDLKKDQDEGDFIVDLQKKEDIENPEEIIRLEKPEIPSQTDKLEALKSKREKVYEEMEEIQTKYKAAKLDLKSKKQELINLHEKFEALNIEKSEKEKNLEKRMKMMELLPSGEENLQKLKDIVAKKKSKILGLQEQFELHKKSILQERDQMKKQIEILKREKYQTNKELTTKEKIQQTKDKIDEQKKFGLKVAKQLEQIPDDYIPRTAYTEQIMDILGKVTKQKSETEKVIEDIKTIQKDINMLEGKLGRTYADVDFRLFEQSKQDKNLIPGYRLLIEIHKASDDIIETIRKTGQVKRSIKTTQESISVEKDKKVEVKLSKLKSDLDQVKQEISKLQSK